MLLRKNHIFSPDISGAIVRRFDEAAPCYDEAASVQAEVAQHLVDWAMPSEPPAAVLDLGCGTGLVAQAVANRWPCAAITALDHAPAMLRQARRKVPGLNIVTGDAARIDFNLRFDAIFSSMTLHWLSEPREVLRRWQGWLKPGGHLYVALLVEGSFREWRAHCATAGLKDGLWEMPRANFADDLILRTERQTFSVTYPSATEFLRRLKSTGAITPRSGHEQFSTTTMRRLLGRAQKPFTASYETLYIDVASSPSI